MTRSRLRKIRRCLRRTDRSWLSNNNECDIECKGKIAQQGASGGLVLSAAMLAAVTATAATPEVIVLVRASTAGCKVNPGLCVNEANIWLAEFVASEVLPAGLVAGGAAKLTAEQLSDVRALMELQKQTGKKVTSETLTSVLGTGGAAKVGGEPPKKIEHADLGELLGRGGNKDVFAYGDNQTVGVLREGKSIESLNQELSILNQLDRLGLPTVNVRGPVLIDGQPALVYEKFASGSKDVVKLKDGKIRVVGESSLLNERSVSDLKAIRQTMVDGDIRINDLQFLIAKDGRVVISDPLDVKVGVPPSYNNLRMIDLLIQQAQKAVGK